MSFPLALTDLFNPVTLMILGVIAVLLFGERLPEVGRTVGKRVIEFRRALQKIQDEIRQAANLATSEIESSGTRHEPSPYAPAATQEERPEDHDVVRAPKFEPPPSGRPAEGATGSTPAAAPAQATPPPPPGTVAAASESQPAGDPQPSAPSGSA